MNVSSVKNLNGEVFSAVQDASLTNVVQTNSSNWDKVTNKLDTTSFSDVSGTFLTAVDLTPYQTIEGMTAYQPVGDYATTAEVDTLSSMLSGAIDYVSANAGDEFPVSADEAIQYVQSNSAQIDDTVTSYQTNSSTYLTEPNLEYNAVNEISGYNGSAIAQYGAEKQWLVHDDTLVHAANSAQYALGVNLSAVAQLLGVDETVLFSGDGTSAANISEPLTNFKTVRFVGYGNEAPASSLQGIFEFPTTNTDYDLHYVRFNQGEWKAEYISRYTENNGQIVLGWHHHYYTIATATTWQGAGECPIFITKVVGIGRKQ